MKWNGNENCLITGNLNVLYIHAQFCHTVFLEWLPQNWSLSSTHLLASGTATKRKCLVMCWKQISCAGLFCPTDDDAGTRVMRDCSTITELTAESLRQFKHSSMLIKVQMFHNCVFLFFPLQCKSS